MPNSQTVFPTSLVLETRQGLFSPFELSLPKNQYTQCDLSDDFAPVVG